MKSLGSKSKTPWSNRISECRKRFSSARNEKIRQEMVDLMDSPDSVLEVGCGTQELKKYLDCNYIGLDFELGFRPQVLANVEALPFGSDCISTVCAKNVLQHTRDWKKALQEIMRVARKKIVLAERTWKKPTKVVSVDENGVIRRRFNRKDLIENLEGWGKVSFKFSTADNRVGIYLGEAGY